MSEVLSNWADSFNYGAARIHRPTNIEQVQEIVARSTKVKAIGTRHSFSRIADTDGDLMSLENLKDITVEGRSVTVGAGVTYGQLCPILSARGLALPNLASLPHVSVVGACATATHGSGDENGNLATSVRAIELVAADGSMVKLDGAEGAAVHLGALGIVTRVTLATIPAFELKQDVYEDVAFDTLEHVFDEATASGYSVSFFTDWRRPIFTQVWVKRMSSDASTLDFFGAKAASGDLHPIKELSPVNCTPQRGVPGPWHERLPHFRMEYTPSSGDELQSEYFLPRERFWPSLRSLSDLSERIAPLLHVSEIRPIAADELWMSPCFRQACVSIHFTWKKDPEAVLELLPLMELKLAEFGARPHWGKLSTMPPALVRRNYPMLPEFRRLVESYDPDGKFRNDWLGQVVF